MLRRIAVVLLVLTACRSGTDPLDGIVVTVSVSPSSARADAPASITTTVLNGASHRVTINANACPAHFRVSTATGVPVALATGLCILSLQVVTLEPGQQFSFHDQWDGRDASGAVRPGEFLITGWPFGAAGPHSAPARLSVQA